MASSAPAARWPRRADIPLLQAGTDINNIESLQRGARNFMNYCSGCHSLKYLRYNRMATDLKIPEAELAKNLMFTADKPFEGITTRHAGGLRGAGSASRRRICR